MHRRRRDGGQRPERPEVLVGLTSGRPPARAVASSIDERPVIRGAQVDPAGDLGDRRVGELRGLLRHVRLFFVPDQRGEPALLAASFEHAAFDQRLAVREVEVPFRRLAAVAVEAVLHERGTDLRLEQGEPLLHPPGVVGRHSRGLSSARSDGAGNRTRTRTRRGSAGPLANSHSGVMGPGADGRAGNARVDHHNASGLRRLFEQRLGPMGQPAWEAGCCCATRDRRCAAA